MSRVIAVSYTHLDVYKRQDGEQTNCPVIFHAKTGKFRDNSF